MVLLMQGWDDLVLSAYLNKSTVPSDIDTFTWRNPASLRVRCSTSGRAPRVVVFGQAMSQVLPTPGRQISH